MMSVEFINTKINMKLREFDTKSKVQKLPYASSCYYVCVYLETICICTAKDEQMLAGRFVYHFLSLIIHVCTKVSNRNSVARNCAQLFSYCAELCRIARKLQGPQLRASKIHLRWEP